nr:uncharacterized protein LOC113692418 [Coffea arabica]
MDDAFIQALLNQHYEGYRVDGTFTTTVYNNIVKELKDKLGKDFTKSHLMNRMKTLKLHFNECYDLFRNGKFSGFSWNPVTKNWNAEPEVWEQLLKEKPDAEKMRTKQIHNYDKLEELFAKDRATGQGAETAKETRNRWANEPNDAELESFIDVDRLLSQNEITIESFDNTTKDTGVKVSKACNKKSVQGTSSTQGKKRKLSVVDEELEIIKGALDNVADAIREGNFIFQNSRERLYTENEIYKELTSIGVEADSIDDCYLFLTQNQVKSRAFFGCPAERRKSILEKMMQQHIGKMMDGFRHSIHLDENLNI